MLMFYSAAGGRAYTRLTDNYQGYVDLSRHLREGQAILVGHSREPASQVTVRKSRGGQTGGATQLANPQDPAVQHWTFYRILLPVNVDTDT